MENIWFCTKTRRNLWWGYRNICACVCGGGESFPRAPHHFRSWGVLGAMRRSVMIDFIVRRQAVQWLRNRVVKSPRNNGSSDFLTKLASIVVVSRQSCDGGADDGRAARGEVGFSESGRRRGGARGDGICVCVKDLRLRALSATAYVRARACACVCAQENPFFVRGRQINVPVFRRHRLRSHRARRVLSTRPRPEHLARRTAKANFFHFFFISFYFR